MGSRVLKREKSYGNATVSPFLPHLFFIGAILWMELVYRGAFEGQFIGRGLLHILLFSIPIGVLFGVLSSLFHVRGNRRMGLCLLGTVTLWFMVQAVYRRIFTTVFVTSSLSMAGQAMSSYWRETLSGIVRTLPTLILLALPMLALIVFKQILLAKPNKTWYRGVIIAVLIQIVATCALFIPTGGLLSMNDLYRETMIPDMSVSNFGVMTTLRLDVKQSIFGAADPNDDGGDTSGIPEIPSIVPDVSDTSAGTDTSTPEPVVYGNNVMDIDFDTLIANETDKTLLGMHKFFATKTPNKQNEYTGMFEGKNLILMTAEAFWAGAVNETYTPTLWKLANEGFVFNNFYNPLWYFSTVDGEYAATTGLIPTNQVNASQRYAGQNKISMYFNMGAQLGRIGYETTAYHNNVAGYYDRNLSHPNLGYDFYAADTGLDVDMSWPQSDLQMLELSLPQALAGNKPFLNYYMTVSGHLQYNFPGNAMARKHKDAVADMPVSEAAKAYVACNMELDKALEYTLKTLEEAGELENTVICISGDHYPYGLDDYAPAMDELTQPGTQESEWEKHRSSLILWSGDMEEPIVVDKLCDSTDVVATLSNLFGVEYDSRLLSGEDILSDAPGLVIFNDKSYITEYGRYSASKDIFYPNEGVEIPEGYAADIYDHVKRQMSYATKILFQDYYRVIGLED